MGLQEEQAKLDFERMYETARRMIVRRYDTEQPEQPDVNDTVTIPATGLVAIFEVIEEDPDGILERWYPAEYERQIMLEGVIIALAALSEYADIEKLQLLFPDTPTLDA